MKEPPGRSRATWAITGEYVRFVGLMVLIAAPMLISSALHYREFDFRFAFFSTLLIIGDLFELALPAGFASYTLSSVPAFSALLLFSREFCIAAMAISGVVEGLVHRKQWPRILFNVAESTISLALAWTVYWSLGKQQVPLLSPNGLVFALVTWIVYYASNVTIVTLSYRRVRKARWSELLHDLSVPLLPVPPIAGVIGITLAAAYQAGGVATFVLFLGLVSIAYVALLTSSVRAKNIDLSTRYEDTQAYLRDLVAGMLNGVLAVDAEKRVAMVNRSAEELLGVSRGELLGREVGEVPELAGTELPAMLGEALESGVGIQARELDWRLAGEQAAVVVCSVSVLRDASGKPSGAVAVLQDVTEQKDIERRLSHLDRLALMGEFAAGVVHEINNPLALITMALDNAKHAAEAGGTAEVSDSLELAGRNLVRLEKLSHRLLSFSRPVPVDVALVDLGDTLNEVLNIVGPQARAVRVRLAREVPRGLALLADESALEQIFLNLAANAIQAMPEGGTLSVSAGRVRARMRDVVAGRVAVAQGTAPSGAHAVRVLGQPVGSDLPEEERVFVWVQFSDTGVGMLPSAVQRLGQSFFTTKEKGTGLGIAIVCKILAQYRGVMEVWSKTGSGTTFRLWFPELNAEELSLSEVGRAAAGVVKETASSAACGEGPLSGWTGLSADLPESTAAPEEPRPCEK